MPAHHAQRRPVVVANARHSPLWRRYAPGPVAFRARRSVAPEKLSGSDFKGRLLHSARWNHGADLAGQRVAVIGTGSTASQLIPPIAERAAQWFVFQRTANWVLPRLDRRYNAVDRALTRLPGYARLVRAFWYRALEWGRQGFDDGTLVRRGMLKTAAAHLHKQVSDAVLRARLQPPYPLGC